MTQPDQDETPGRRQAPPDRGMLLTEQRLDASRDLDALDVTQALELINSQDAQVADTVRGAIPVIADLVRAAEQSLRRGGRLIYVGAGTSGRLGVLDASECPPTFHCDPMQVVGVIAGGDGALRRSSEGAEDDADGAADEWRRLGVGPDDLIVGIAAGGSTPYVLGALRDASSRGARTALVCCVGGEEHPPRIETAPAELLIELPVGPEVLTGSTRMKAGTATKMVLNMISTALFVRLGKSWGNLMVDLKASNAKLRDRAVRILLEQCPSLGGSRTAAQQLLEKAEGRVKIALVMAGRELGAAAAQKLLDENEGRLRPILGAPREP